MNELKTLISTNYQCLSEMNKIFKVVTEERVQQKAIEISIMQYAKNKNMTTDEVFSMINKAIDDQEREVTENET